MEDTFAKKRNWLRPFYRIIIITVGGSITIYITATTVMLPRVVDSNNHRLGTTHYYYRQSDVAAQLDALLRAMFSIEAGDPNSFRLLLSNQELVIAHSARYKLQFVFRTKGENSYIFLRSFPAYGPWHRVYRSGEVNRIGPDLYPMYHLPKLHAGLK